MIARGPFQLNRSVILWVKGREQHAETGKESGGCTLNGRCCESITGREKESGS